MTNSSEIGHSPVIWGTLFVPFICLPEVALDPNLKDLDAALVFSVCFISIRYTLAVCFTAYGNMDEVLDNLKSSLSRVFFWSSLFLMLFMAAALVPITSVAGSLVSKICLGVLLLLPTFYWWCRDNSDIKRVLSDERFSENNKSLLLLAFDILIFAAFVYGIFYEFSPLLIVSLLSLLYDVILGRMPTFLRMLRDLIRVLAKGDGSNKALESTA